MKFKRVVWMALLGLTGAHAPVVLAQNPPDKDPNATSDISIVKHVKLSVHLDAKGGVGSNGNLETLYSQLAFYLQNRNFDDFLANFGTSTKKVETVWTLSIKITPDAIINDGAVRSGFNSLMEQNLVKVGADMTATLTAQIDSQLQQNPQYQALSPDEQKQIRDQFLGNVKGLADQYVKDARDEFTLTRDERIAKLRKELFVQEFAISAGRTFGGGRRMIFVKIGKFSPTLGGVVDRVGETSLESIRAQHSRIQRANSTAPSSAVEYGFVQKVHGSDTLEVNVIGYQQLEAYISAQDYERMVLNIPEWANEYKQFDVNYGHLNAVAFRTLLRTKRLDLYATESFSDSHSFLTQTGFEFRVNSKDRLNVDFYNGRRLQITNGQSVFYSHDFHSALTGFLGLEQSRDALEPSEGLVTPTDLRYATLGLFFGRRAGAPRSGIFSRKPTTTLAVEFQKNLNGDEYRVRVTGKVKF